MKGKLFLLILLIFIIFPSSAFAFDELGDGLAELGAILVLSYIFCVVVTIFILIFNRGKHTFFNNFAYTVCTIGILTPILFCIWVPVGGIILIMLLPLFTFLFILLIHNSQVSNFKKKKAIT